KWVPLSTSVEMDVKPRLYKPYLALSGRISDAITMELYEKKGYKSSVPLVMPMLTERHI
ncbi:10510_t:CDS:2, partial [Ambispora leptoticha]